MQEIIFPALHDKCEAFAQDAAKQQAGELDADNLFRWQAFFVHSGNPDLAMEFTKLNPGYTDDDISSLDRFLVSSEGSGIKPTKCCTFGCPTEQITLCHNKVITNSSGELSNSPAYFISEKALESRVAQEKFDELKNEIFERIIAGDKTAHTDEDFIKAAAALKARDSHAFNELKENLAEMKVKLASFNEEVAKLSKSRAKEKQTAEVVQIDLPEKLKPYAEGIAPDTSFIDENGHIIAMVKEGYGYVPVQASNFVARIKEVREFDDGVEIAQQFVIDGLLDGEKELPAVIINAKDFRSMNWVERLWGNLLITSAPKARDIVRETIQRVSVNAPITKVHYSLGWKNIDGVWHYLYSGGAIGGDGVSVAEISELKGYFFQDYPHSVEECAKFVQKFIDIADHEITIPLLAHAFLSILIEKLKLEEIEPRYLMWVYGVSGSFKTALMTVLINFFGSFNSPPATFNDTAAAQEKKAYLTKDSLLLVDDFHPSASPQEAKAKATLANALTRKYGDRITRSRSKSNLTLAKEYPPRGNLVCTSEDLLIGHSTNSRHMGIEIRRGAITPDILTELQNNKEHLAAFMVHFIKYVSEKIMNDATVTYKEKFLEYRGKSQNSNHHKRFAEAIACLQIGWETLLEFLQHVEHIDEAQHQAYFDEGFSIFQVLAKRQNDLVQSDDMADKFMSALKELIDTKQITPVQKDAPSTLNKGSTVCYHDEEYFYFVPGSTYAAVAEFFIRRGDLLNVNEYMLRKMLADRG